MPGHLTGLRLENLQGSPTQPIEVVNCGGQVVIGALPGGTSNGLIVTGSRHVKVTGTGAPGTLYGIKVDTTSSQGVSIAGASSDVEVEFLEVTHTGFAGIMAKTDPGCDGSYTRGTFTQYNTLLHDNYIHDVGAEGFYIGHSFYYGYTKHQGCPGTLLYPHALVGVRIHDNVVKNADADGIQVGAAIQDVAVYNNCVDGYGQDPFEPYQDNAVQIGEGATGMWYNNKLKRGPGNAFIVIGQGAISVFNNVAEDTSGVYVHNKVPSGSTIALLNNTLIGTKARGFEFNNTSVPVRLHNNLMAMVSGVLPVKNAGSNVTQSHNLFNSNLNSFGFVNAAGGDYHLTPGSPARDAGLNLPNDLGSDHDDTPRNDGRYDIGAYEYNPGNVVFTQDFSSSTVVGSYVSTTPGTRLFDDISAEPNGGTFSLNAGQLRLVRTGSSATDNDAGLTRSTDLAGPPSVLHMTFDLAVSSWTLSPFQSNAFCMDVGRFSGVFDYGSAGALGDVFNSLCVTGKGAGSFAFVIGGAQSSSFAANGTAYRLSYFLNKSGAPRTYRAPDGSTRNLQANGVALWDGTTVLFNNIAASNGTSSTLTDFRMRWSNPDNATWQLDNLLLRSTLPQ